VDDISKTEIVGLSGKFLDKVRDNASFVEEDASKILTVGEEVDRVYCAADGDIGDKKKVTVAQVRSHMVDDVLTTVHEHIVHVERLAFTSSPSSGETAGGRSTAAETLLPTDCVLWNGWTEKCAALADMDDDAYLHYVCVEPGLVSRNVVLQPGSAVSLTQLLTVSNMTTPTLRQLT
jgi:D-hexose-6-phosphate mutarotase